MSEDLIKRSDAIKALNREKSDWNCDYNVPIDNCIKRLNKVKSADRPSAVDLSSVYSTAYKSGYEKGKADRPQGEWKRRLVDNGFNADWVCSECGYRVKTDFVSFNFCPNCGARMKGADDERLNQEV